MPESDGWFIVKNASGNCDIVMAQDWKQSQDAAPDQTNEADRQYWGPFPSQAEAIARRVGLIRAGYCQPR